MKGTQLKKKEITVLFLYLDNTGRMRKRMWWHYGGQL